MLREQYVDYPTQSHDQNKGPYDLGRQGYQYNKSLKIIE
jgi:hypothetical protein